ncbi:hypothetical protein [uncultured Microbacterium sp.]|uniref:hypothetical protein n=1 Tax=uncultured Microbacterium sp. TaxID=191216 RepID=UPI0025E20BD4|nr:hypothetical protein [uncultured Microbacterium sp.]
MSPDPDGETVSSATAGGTDGGKSPWADIVGPCYTVESLSRVIGLSPVQIGEAADRLTVLRLRTADDVDLFPAFQVRDGQVCPDLSPCSRRFAAV